ncbi:MAG TPA: HAD hydrolase-like protein [Candidatus Eisenbacteria bacterium]
MAEAARPRAGVVCLDVDGTLTDGVRGPALPGAVSALRALRARLPVRLVTNTTSVPFRALAEYLAGLGLLDSNDALFTPHAVARRLLPSRGHDAGILIADPGQREELAWFREDPAGPAVLLATEAHAWTVDALQPAFRRLLDGATFYSMTRNRYFRRGDAMVTDVGAVAALLAYASGREPETLGKPSRAMFEAVARDAGSAIEEMAMVGDDAEFDVSAAVALGMRGALLRTGKYREGDEARVTPPPTAVLDSIRDVPAWLGAA